MTSSTTRMMTLALHDSLEEVSVSRDGQAEERKQIRKNHRRVTSSLSTHGSFSEHSIPSSRSNFLFPSSSPAVMRFQEARGAQKEGNAIMIRQSESKRDYISALDKSFAIYATRNFEYLTLERDYETSIFSKLAKFQRRKTRIASLRGKFSTLVRAVKKRSRRELSSAC